MSDKNSNITSAQVSSDSEERLEMSLRPKYFKDVIGREREKKSLQIMIESAKKRNKTLDHVLFHGPPGLGKTTLSFVIGNEMNSPVHVTSGSAIDKQGDLAAILTSLEDGSILFIDEIHRLKRTIEEILYPAMEDSAIDIVIGKGPNARTLRLDLPQFTIIGATTKLSMLSAPLRDRFGMNFRLDFYSDIELKDLINQKAQMLGVEVTDEAALQIARRSRMTARIAIRILKRVRDLAVVKGEGTITSELVDEALEILNIDADGLHEIDREILHNLIHTFDGKPVGLGTLAASVAEEKDTIESVYEPFLLKIGLIKRTPRGRQVTEKAVKLFNIDVE